MLWIIFVTFLITSVFGAILMFCSWVFRRILIKSYAFTGIDPDSAHQFIMVQPFRKRLFMAYVRKCNSTGKQSFGLTIWFLVCHYIHAMVTIVVIIMIWLDVLFRITFRFDLYILGVHVTRGTLVGLLEGAIIWTLPISIALALPFMLFSKKEKGGLLPASKWEGMFEKGMIFFLNTIFPSSKEEESQSVEKDLESEARKPPSVEKKLHWSTKLIIIIIVYVILGIAMYIYL